jgi:hypothetical protein
MGGTGRLSSVGPENWKSFLIWDIEKRNGLYDVGDSTGFEASILERSISRPAEFESAPLGPSCFKLSGWDREAGALFHVSGSLSEIFLALGPRIANWRSTDSLVAAFSTKRLRVILSRRCEGGLTQDPPKPP